MRSADFSMLIIIRMYSKLKRVLTTNCVYFFLILNFSALRVGLRFLKKI